MSRGRRRNVEAVLVLVLTFVLGAISGAGVWHWGHGPPHRPPGPHGPVPVRELDLTPEQARQVEAILERHRPEVEAVFQESRPRIEAINTRILSEVREILTDVQRERLDAIRARGGPPRGGPPRGGPPHGGPPHGGPPHGGPRYGGPPHGGPPRR